ncbi:MAG: hypothetical protein ACK47B_28345 [Armatimonadota bacterium]
MIATDEDVLTALTEPPFPVGEVPAEPGESGTRVPDHVISDSPLSGKAVCLAVTIRALGTRRTVESSRIETDADRSLVHVGKEILDCPEVDALRGQEGRIRKHLRRKTVPSLVFRRGVTLCPLASLDEVDATLFAFQQERREMVEALVAALPARVEEARERLGSWFDASDYPSPERIRAGYELEWRYLAAAVPGSLKTFRRDIYEREQEKIEELYRKEWEYVRQCLRLELNALVEHLAERLTPTATGEKKVFKSSTVTELLDWIRSFDPRNLTDDQELAGTVQRLERLLQGIDPETLRKSESARNLIRGGLDVVRTSLTAQIVSVERAYDFGD